MRTRRRSVTAALVAGLVSMLALGLPSPSAASPEALGTSGSSGTSDTSAALPRLRISGHYVAGISSGGFMATQLQVAHSATFDGAAAVSAGTYHCADGNLVLALEACMVDALPSQLPASIAYAESAARNGLIDPVSNLARHRTWLFHGTRDATVVGTVADELDAFHRHFGALPTYSSDVPAGHGWISPLGPVACGDTAAPFINDCGFDAQRQMLGTMLGSVSPPNTGAPKGSVVPFSQDPHAALPSPGLGDVTRTGAAAIGMGPTGYAYIPDLCRKGTSCRLLVALHGCQQTAGQIGTTFVDRAFLNEYADTNKIVVLYPQARVDETFGNPKGCWDWWGYLGPNDGAYATRSGPQVATIMNMVRALGG